MKPSNVISDTYRTCREYLWSNGLLIVCPVCSAAIGAYCDISENNSATRPSSGRTEGCLHRVRTDTAHALPWLPGE